MLHIVRDLKSLLYQDILRRNKKTPFIIAVSFIVAFLIARGTVLFGPEWLRLYISQYHIHHFYYGFALVAISNWIALTTNREHMFNFAAVLFGAGLGLFIDEFGLLLTCTTPPMGCDYYARQSYDAFTVLVAAFFAVIYSKPIFGMFKHVAKKALRRK